MIIDGQKVEQCIEYTFPKKGNHTVFFLSDFSKITVWGDARNSLLSHSAMPVLAFPKSTDIIIIIKFLSVFYVHYNPKAAILQ